MSPDVDQAMEQVDTDIRAEINTVLPGSDPLQNLHVTHEGGHEYNVLSARNGSVTKHYVSVGETPTCTCEDYQYNRDGQEVCAHIAAAVLGDRMDPGEMATQELINVTATVSSAIREAEGAAAEARDAADQIESALVKTRDAQAEETVETERNGHSDTSGGSNDAEIAEKAEKLQEAYDAVIDGMAVEYANGAIWVNITPQAPEELPGPGSISTFNALLRDADQINYSPDDQSAPGQYFKNRINPDDVNSYISEVLE